MLWNCLVVGCGGFIGSVLRYLCSFLRVEGIAFPVVTLGVNIVGSFAIMFFAGVCGNVLQIDDRLMLFFRIGICGGFTTFSTFSAETVALLEQGDLFMAFLYMALSLTLCLGAAFLGQTASALFT